MGKLKDIRLPTLEVALPNGGGNLTVRGFSLIDITALVRGRFDEVAALFERYAPQVEGNGVSDAAMMSIGADLVDKAPDIVAHIIVLASDGDDDDLAMARRLPFPVQVEALEKIAQLTFEAGGGPKKVLETVVRVVSGLTSEVRGVRLSKLGSLATGDRSASS